MKKFVNLLFVAASITALASCKTNNDERQSRPKSFSFAYRRSGYDEWGKEVANYYMDHVDQDVYIDCSYFENSETIRNNIISGAAGLADLYQLEVDLSGGENYLVELTDVYNSLSPDEGNTSVLIKDKIDEDVLAIYNEKSKNEQGVYEDHFYRMPQTLANGWNWVYNKTTLNLVLGENNWELPRTTDEMFALYERIVESNKAFPIVMCGDGNISGEYIRYGNEIWFAQMMGKEKYDAFFDGYYFDENNERKFALNAPTQIENARDEINAAYNTIYRLFNQDNFYVHPKSGSFDFNSVNEAIYSGYEHSTGRKFSTEGGSKTYLPPCFAFLGTWMEKEIKDDLEAGYITKEGQEILAMRMPIISSIINRTPSIKDDATLSKVIDYVDGKLGEVPEGVTENDVAIIKEARSFIPELICREMAIPKTSNNVEEAKKFLKWLTTEEAQVVVSKYTGGINILPYGYSPKDEDMGFSISNYIKSFNDIALSSTVIDEGRTSRPYAKFVNNTWFSSEKSDAASLNRNIFNGKANLPSDDNVTYFYNKVYGNGGSTYSNLMKTFKNRYPDYVDDWGNI